MIGTGDGKSIPGAARGSAPTGYDQAGVVIWGKMEFYVLAKIEVYPPVGQSVTGRRNGARTDILSAKIIITGLNSPLTPPDASPVPRGPTPDAHN